jgi:hypothetical protein
MADSSTTQYTVKEKKETASVPVRGEKVVFVVR